MVLYQDGNMRAAGKAQLYKYDGFGRVVSYRIGTFAGTVDSSCYPDSALDNLEGQMGSVFVQYTYDTPDNTRFAAVSGIVETADRDDNVHSLKTYEKVAVLGDNYTVAGYVERWFYYDYRGRVIQTVSKYPDGSEHRVSTKYDFTGNVTASRETYTHGSTTDTLDRTFDYDARGRLLSETSTIGGVSSSVNYSYDSVGRLTGKSYGGTTLTETLAYNIQGWQTAQIVKKGTETLFDNSLKYYDGTTPLYSGNISEWSWTQKGQTENSYRFAYDHMSRLTGADHYVGSAKVDKFTEKAIAYDKNSNLTSMTRYVNGVPSNIAFTYSGNRRNGYNYDNNGNISKDVTNNLDITYNFLNLPTMIKQNSAVKATYTYLADGCKYKTINASGGGYDYVGSFKYNRNGSNMILESVAGSGGRIYKTSGGYEVRYFVSDHLGSTRLVANSGGTVLEQNDYMPYGERHANSALATSTNPYLYNGKESQKDFGVNYIDSHARMQRTDGQFNSIDLLCERHYHITPYTYCGGDPINTTDPFGLDFWITTNPEVIKQLLNYFGSMGTIDTSMMTHFTDDEFLSTNPSSDSYLRQSDSGKYYFTWKTSDQDGVHVHSYEFPTLSRSISSNASFSLDYNTHNIIGNVMSSVGVVAGIGENLMFSKEFNTWMGKDWKIRSQNWGGNGITGGKFKYAAKVARFFKWTGYGATFINIANTELMYKDSLITKEKRWIEHGSSAISLIPLYGTAWALGWEAGKLCVPLFEEE